MILTSGQLYDLLSKAKKKATQTGPRGGKFYVSTEGSKVYTGEPSVPPPSTRPPPVVHHFISAAPHSSAKTQSPVAVEANVEITKLPMKQKVVPAEQRFRPKTKSTPSSRVAVKEAMKRWPAYVCRSCRAVILPTFAKQTQRNRVLGVKPLVHTSKLGQVTVVGWQVHTEEEGVHETYNADSKAEAASLAEDLRQHFQEEEPWQKKDELIAVHKTVIEGESKHHTLLEPGAVQPEMVGKKLCPDCFGKHEVISREVTGRTAIKPTRESKAVARQRAKEQKQKERALEAALKKFPGKRTEAERQLVSEHEAIQNTRQRAEEEKRQQQRRAQGRKASEQVWIESQEQAALAKLRHYYRDRLIRQGKDPSDAAREAANLTDAELRKFQEEMARAHAKRREETIKQIETESGSRKVVPVVSGYEIEEHMERRRQGAPGGEERGIYEETLHPAEAKAAELLRTARLRERELEKEKGPAKEEKPKKRVDPFLKWLKEHAKAEARRIKRQQRKAKKGFGLFISLNKGPIWESAKTPEEAEYWRKEAEKDFPRRKPVSEPKKIKTEEPKKPPRDIDLELAHHLTHVFHHIDHWGGGARSMAHEPAFQHHWEEAHKLIQQGADAQDRHFDAVGKHHQKRADQLVPSPHLGVRRSESHMANRRYHSRMEGAANHLYHMPSIARELRTRISDSHGNPPSLYRLRRLTNN